MTITSSSAGIDVSAGTPAATQIGLRSPLPNDGPIDNFDTPVKDLLTHISTATDKNLIAQLQAQALDTLMSPFQGSTARLPAALIYSTVNLGTLLLSTSIGVDLIARIANWTTASSTGVGQSTSPVTMLDATYQEAVRYACKIGLTSPAEIFSVMS